MLLQILLSAKWEFRLIFSEDGVCINAAAMLDAPTQSQEVADDDMEPAPDREVEDMPVAGPAAPAKPRTITKRRRR